MMRMTECNKCGECCKYLTFTIKNVKRNPLLLDYYKKHGCRIEGEMIVVPSRCQHLDENNLCKIYPDRPSLCKVFKGQSFGHYVPKECVYNEEKKER